jgi:hypothetical protein
MGNWKEVKDHPIYILVGAVVAAVILAVGATAGVYEKLIFPVRVAETQPIMHGPTTTSSESVNASSAATVVDQPTVWKQLEEAKVELAKAKADLSALRLANMFTAGSPYPVGLGQVKIGDAESDIPKYFDETKIDRTPENNGSSYISIEQADPIFTSIVYYYDNATKNHRITHIAFNTNFHTLPANYLLNRFTELFGQPILDKRKGFYSWEVPGKQRIYMSDQSSYLVMNDQFRPGYW